MAELLDLRTLCNALGFMAVVILGPRSIRRPGEAARRALAFAAKIEEFCLLHAQDQGGFEDEVHASPSAEGPMAIIMRMAQAIAEIVGERDGACQPDELLAKGFTRAQIGRHWLTAQALAHVILNQPLPPTNA